MIAAMEYTEVDSPSPIGGGLGRKRPRRTASSSNAKEPPTEKDVDVEKDRLRRRVEELERYAQELEGRLHAAVADSSSLSDNEGEKTCEACGRRLPRDDDDNAKPPRIAISLAALERDAPRPVGEADDPSAPVVDGRTDPDGSFAQKCNWLRAYFDEHGHCDVPNPKPGFRHPRYQRLMRFVQRVRAQYHADRSGDVVARRRGVALKLTPDRIKTLADIGLRWQVKLVEGRPDFDETFGLVQAFYAERGHCCMTASVVPVPRAEEEGGERRRTDDPDPAVIEWLKEVRTSLRALSRPEGYFETGSRRKRDALTRARRFLTEERRVRLAGLDCPWLHEGRNIAENGDEEEEVAGAGAAEGVAETEDKDHPEDADANGGKVAPPSGGNASACSLEAEDVDDNPCSASEALGDDNENGATEGEEPPEKSCSKSEEVAAEPNTSSGEAAWATFFKRLEEARRFKAERGHLFVDTTRAAKGSLGHFIREHRRLYNRLRGEGGGREVTESTATAAEKYRLRRLEELGVEFDAAVLGRRTRDAARARTEKLLEERDEEERARVEGVREAAGEAERALERAERAFKDAEKALREAKERALETERKRTEEDEKAAKNPVGRLARIAPRGGTRREGLAEVTFASTAVVVGETLTFYSLRWPDDGKEERGVEGRHATVLFTEGEVVRARKEIAEEDEDEEKSVETTFGGDEVAANGAADDPSAEPTADGGKSSRVKRSRHGKYGDASAPPQRQAVNMKGRGVIVLPRGGGKLTGEAKVDVVSNAKVLDQVLTYYAVIWPDGRRETAIEGRFVHLLTVTDASSRPAPKQTK